MTNTDQSEFKTFQAKARRKSPILRKCENLMETLWTEGYRKQITWNLLREYITKHCGGFRTTQQDYLGRRADYFKSRGREGCLKTPARKGYLEKFGFIQVLNAKIIFLDHERVDRDYHRSQAKVDGASFSLTCLQGGIENGETRENEREEREIQSEREKLSPTLVSHNLTSEEQAILTAQPDGKEKSLPKIVWPEQDPYSEMEKHLERLRKASTEGERP
jgi:hypothetical protein